MKKSTTVRIVQFGLSFCVAHKGYGFAISGSYPTETEARTAYARKLRNNRRANEAATIWARSAFSSAQ